MGHYVTALIVLVATIIYSLLGFWIGINGLTTTTIIERLPLLYSPAPFVYLMTFLVAGGLVYYMWQSIKDRKSPYAITGLQLILIIAASFLQISFFFTWHAEDYMPAFVILVLQIVSLFALHTTYSFEQQSIKKRIPIALWLGWQLFFIFIIISFLAVYYEWSGFGLSSALWVVIWMTICTAIALHIRYHHHDRVTPTVVIWGFLGIIVANGFDELFVSTATLFLIGVLLAGILFIEKNKKKTTES